MKHTYTGTLFHPILTDATIKLYVSMNKTKYDATDEEPQLITYNNVISWDIIEGGEEAEQLKAVGFEDDYDEFLVLHLGDGGTVIYPNSYVDMFIR